MAVSITQTTVAVFRVIRAVNLLVLSGALILIRHTLVLPILQLKGTASSMSDSQYLLMTFSVVLTAASGYLINNLLDMETDAANGKNRGLDILGFRTVRALYFIITIAAVNCAFILGKGSWKSMPFLITSVSCGLLYFYSLDYKKIPFVSGFTVFAFMLTLIRELIKCCEDVEGDASTNVRTLAVVWGTKSVSIATAVISTTTFGLIAYIQYATAQWEDPISFAYMSLFVSLPLAYLSFALFKAREHRQFSALSKITKLIMVTGILTLLVFYLTS
jgi:4-hydroxybenzoate polyprenyltransferase